MKARKNEITIKPVLYTYYANAQGLHPVRLRVIADRKSMNYPILCNDQKIFLSPTEWEALKGDGLRGERKELQKAIKAAEAKAEEVKDSILNKGLPFTFPRFESDYLHSNSSKTFIQIWEEYLKELMKEGRVGTSVSYGNALAAFKKFIGTRTNIKAEEITVSFLKDFEEFLKKPKPFKTTRGKARTQKAGKTTVGIYMRVLKIIFNLAAEANPSLRENYPFATKANDRTRYKIKTGSGHKGEALTLDELKKFIDAEVIETTPEWEAKNLFLFSLFCQGMNFRDMALLKYSNIKGDSISYVRQKTRETEAKETELTIPLTDPVGKIIRAIGNPDKRPQSYVFGILTQGMEPLEMDKAIRQKIKVTNKWLRKLCNANGLPEVTTYWARHTFATLLKFSGESVEVIRQLLGHSDIRTTEAYLKRFDESRVKASHDRIQSLLKSA